VNRRANLTLDELIGRFYDPVTWYKITHKGEQIAQWDQNNATCTSPPGPAFVLEVSLRNLLTSMFLYHVIVQRPCWVGGDAADDVGW